MMVSSLCSVGRRQLIPWCPTQCLVTTQTVWHIHDTSWFQDVHHECIQGKREWRGGHPSTRDRSMCWVCFLLRRGLSLPVWHLLCRLASRWRCIAGTSPSWCHVFLCALHDELQSLIYADPDLAVRLDDWYYQSNPLCSFRHSLDDLPSFPPLQLFFNFA